MIERRSAPNIVLGGLIELADGHHLPVDRYFRMIAVFDDVRGCLAILHTPLTAHERRLGYVRYRTLGKIDGPDHGLIGGCLDGVADRCRIDGVFSTLQCSQNNLGQ